MWGGVWGWGIVIEAGMMVWFGYGGRDEDVGVESFVCFGLRN